MPTMLVKPIPVRFASSGIQTVIYTAEIHQASDIPKQAVQLFRRQIIVTTLHGMNLFRSFGNPQFFQPVETAGERVQLETTGQIQFRQVIAITFQPYQTGAARQIQSTQIVTRTFKVIQTRAIAKVQLPQTAIYTKKNDLNGRNPES